MRFDQITKTSIYFLLLLLYEERRVFMTLHYILVIAFHPRSLDAGVIRENVGSFARSLTDFWNVSNKFNGSPDTRLTYEKKKTEIKINLIRHIVTFKINIATNFFIHPKEY